MAFQHFCVIITTYNPNIGRFRKVLDAIRDQVAKIIVDDNGSTNLNEIRQAIANVKNAETVEKNRYYEIGKALNIGIERLIGSKTGCDYILTLDQDSVVLVDIKGVLASAEQVYNRSELGIILLGADNIRKSADLQKDTGKISNFECVDFPIISGSLVSAEVYKKNIQGKVSIGKNTRISDDSVIRGPATFGDDTEVNGAFIGPYTSIGNNCKVSRVSIENSIVMSNSRIETDSVITDSIIGNSSVVLDANSEKPKGTKLVVGENSRIYI